MDEQRRKTAAAGHGADVRADGAVAGIQGAGRVSNAGTGEVLPRLSGLHASGKRVIGIDPGANTGIAVFLDGKLELLFRAEPIDIEPVIAETRPSRVVFEDSRLQSHTWTTASSRAAAAKMARNVGQIDAWCNLIVAICAKYSIPAHGISPLSKGAKVNQEQFAKLTGWGFRTNEHERDAAMVAWKYRGAA